MMGIASTVMVVVYDILLKLFCACDLLENYYRHHRNPACAYLIYPKSSEETW